MVNQTKNLQKNKELTDGMNEKDLTNMYRTFHLSNFSKNFSKNHHVMHSKANIDRYEKNGLTLCILLEHQDLKLLREWKEASLK